MWYWGHPATPRLLDSAIPQQMLKYDKKILVQRESLGIFGTLT